MWWNKIRERRGPQCTRHLFTPFLARTIAGNDYRLVK